MYDLVGVGRFAKWGRSVGRLNHRTGVRTFLRHIRHNIKRVRAVRDHVIGDHVVVDNAEPLIDLMIARCIFWFCLQTVISSRASLVMNDSIFS